MQLPRSAFRVAASARPGVVERDLRRAVVVLLLAASFGIRLAFGGTGPVELVPILLGAAWFGLRAARLTTTVAVCLLIVAAGLGGVPVGTAVVTALLVVASGELVARLFERLDTQASELRGLRPLQEALAPTAPPELPLLEVGVRHLPATPGVAGDFYLVAEGHNNSTVIAVGDVMGKGMKAAERATFIRATLAALAATTDDPAYLLQGANAQLVRQCGASADFVTMVCMVIRADASLSFASAGHPAPVSLADGSPLGNPPPCFPLGIAPELSGVKPVAAKLPDAGVVLYTDGLTDAKPHNFEPFGRKRIGLVLKDLADPSPQVAVDHLAAAARVFARRALSDDVCLVAVRSKLARPRVERSPEGADSEGVEPVRSQPWQERLAAAIGRGRPDRAGRRTHGLAAALLVTAACGAAAAVAAVGGGSDRHPRRPMARRTAPPERVAAVGARRPSHPARTRTHQTPHMVRLVRLGNAPRHARGAALVADGHLDLTVRGLGRPRVRRGTVWLSNSTGDAIPIAHFMGARASLQIKLPQGSSRFRFIQVSIRPGPPTQPDVSSSVLRAALP